MGDDASSSEGKMVWREFQPKAWEETDVDIKVTHSGICGSDLHTLRSGWVGLILIISLVSATTVALTEDYLGRHGVPVCCRARNCWHRSSSWFRS